MSSASAAAGYMVQHDLHATHARRVHVLVLLVSFLLMGFGSGWAVFFALRGAWLVVPVDVGLTLLGLIGWWLLRRGEARAASLLISISLLALFAGVALVLDVPSAEAPRSMHHYLIPVAVASYLLLRYEATWFKHAIPIACLVVVALLADGKAAPVAHYTVPEDVRRVGTWVNNICAMGILYLLVHVFMGDITRMESYLHGANNRFVGLVRGMFPKVVAERLLAQGQSFAEKHANCSVLFADIAGFTGITERMAPEALVGMLSDIFSRFDRCVEQAGLTKIKTIGDAYMVASGVPEPDPRHAHALVALALAMQREVRGHAGIQLRIGIASGELVAGVIGQSRQLFDVWGDVVNVAARTEARGLPGRVQVARSCWELVKHDYEFEPRAGVTVQGKAGAQEVFLLPAGTAAPGLAA